MSDKNEPQRGLEKIYHFFLTEEASSIQKSEPPGDISIANGTAHIPNSTILQHPDGYNLLKNTLAQLYVLKESCKVNYYNSQKSNEDIIWFQGAEAILQDAIVNLIKTLRLVETTNNEP